LLIIQHVCLRFALWSDTSYESKEMRTWFPCVC